MEHTSEATTPVAKVPPPLVTPSTAGSSSGNLVHDAVPPEILQSRVNLPGTMPPDHHSKAPPTTSPRLTRAPLPSRASHHRSFVLDYPSMVLAQHFAMIDRELFLAVKFEELTDTELLPSTQDSNFLDWAQFLRDRYTAKAEGRYGTITMSLVAVRARFNLVAGFVVSQILLASPHERASTFSKLLRVAWVCF
jgi:GDP/GTP exchange factor required for growth at low temperature